MKFLITFTVLACAFFQASYATSCVQCKFDGTTQNTDADTCGDKKTLPAATACVNGFADADICVYSKTKTPKGEFIYERKCGFSGEFNSEKNKCYSNHYFGTKSTTCTCDKTKTDSTKACNGSSNINMSIVAVLAMVAVSKYLL